MGNIRKIFEVLIHNKQFDVYDIEGKEHDGYNGEPKSWWIYYADSLPEGMLPPIDSSEWEPYSNSINRRLWDIRFKESNTSKIKWDERRFSHHLHCEMYCNNKLVYSFGTSKLDFAFAKAQYLIVKMSEHSYNFFEPEKEKGRKIWWYGLPATISPKTDGWEIGIIPDYSAGLDKKEWWAEFISRRANKNEVVSEDDIDIWYDEDEMSEYINWGDALSDQHINWHRK